MRVEFVFFFLLKIAPVMNRSLPKSVYCWCHFRSKTARQQVQLIRNIRSENVGQRGRFTKSPISSRGGHNNNN